MPTDIARRLLSPSDVGAEFTARFDELWGIDMPCNSVKPRDEANPVRYGDVTLDNADGSDIAETLDVFGTAHDAEAYQSALESGLDCSKGSSPIGPFTLSGPTDLSSVITANVASAKGWSYRSGDLRSAFVLVRLDHLVMSFVFRGPSSLQHFEVDPPHVMNAGLTKVLYGHATASVAGGSEAADGSLPATASISPTMSTDTTSLLSEIESEITRDKSQCAQPDPNKSDGCLSPLANETCARLAIAYVRNSQLEADIVSDENYLWCEWSKFDTRLGKLAHLDLQLGPPAPEGGQCRPLPPGVGSDCQQVSSNEWQKVFPASWQVGTDSLLVEGVADDTATMPLVRRLVTTTLTALGEPTPH